jgi:hypothetical protein
MTWTALPITSAGRLSPLGPRGMDLSVSTLKDGFWLFEHLNGFVFTWEGHIGRLLLFVPGECSSKVDVHGLPIAFESALDPRCHLKPYEFPSLDNGLWIGPALRGQNSTETLPLLMNASLTRSSQMCRLLDRRQRSDLYDLRTCKGLRS